MDEQIFAFDWKGYMAHFRQLDANSSSLSYSFPPPTVVCGMLAGIIGIEKDEYYEQFSPDHVRVGVQIVTPPRKLMQTINYMKVLSPQELNMSNKDKHTQIPVELLVNKAFPSEPLHYRIFVKVKDPDLYGHLVAALQAPSYRYLPFLGSASFSSWLEWPGLPERIELVHGSEPTAVDTAVSLSSVEIKSLRMEAIDGVFPAYFREHLRRMFLPDREPGEVIDVVWERNRGKIKARFTEPVFRLKFAGQTINVAFL